MPKKKTKQAEKGPVQFSKAVFRRTIGKTEVAFPKFEDIPEGWSKVAQDPMELLAGFSRLELKKGYVLRAYQFKEGCNGNGAVFAMGPDAPFPDPQECERSEHDLFETPLPEGANPKFMRVINGDGTPKAFLQASIFAREAHALGAMWHGRNWSIHSILFEDPVITAEKEKRKGEWGGPDWKWIEPRPKIWKPHYRFVDGRAQIVFLSESGLGSNTISRHVDVFHKNSMEFWDKYEVLADGGRGFIH